MSYSEIKLSTHVFFKKTELRRPIDSLKRMFTLTSKYNADTIVHLYKEDGDWFGVPRYYHKDVSGLPGTILDQRAEGESINIEMAEGFQLRDNQTGVFEEFCNQLQKGRTGFLLEATTGFGKTVVASAIIREINTTTLIIVPRDFLLEQWIDRLITHTNMQREDIGIIKQGTCEFRNKKVVVGLIHSLAKDKYLEAMKQYFGLVVWDEVHVTGAESFSETIGMFPAKYRLGMSATPKRKDGLGDVFNLSIKQTLLRPQVKVLVKPLVFLRKYTAKTKHQYLSKMRDATSRRGVLISELGKDLARNALIAVYAKKFHDSSRRVLILSDRTEQLSLLKDILVKRHGITANKVGMFTGSTKENDRKIILSSSDIILATYGVMAMGVDVPDLRALIFATPLSDVEQSVGRILRLCESAKEPVVLDLIDTAYADCVRWAYSRRAFYEDKAGARIINVE